MRNKQTVNWTVSLDFACLLTIVFIALKLMGYIDWSWRWVLSPLWIGFLFVILIVLIVFIVIFIQEE